MNPTRRNLILGAVAAGSTSVASGQSESEFYHQLVRANNEAVPATIREAQSQRLPRFGIRRTGVAIETLTAAFCSPESSYYKSADLIPPMVRAALTLLEAQYPDGTIDSGNLNSPPDTGFVLESVCRALAVLRRLDDARLTPLRDHLGRFILAAGEAQVTGGVHTPNHRWVICSALARINSLFPAEKYVRRIDQWLAEGIYIDDDGQYSERSTGIYSHVIDDALVTMARLLDRPKLLDPVRRNLTMNLYYTHPDGEVETVASRRQDQGMIANVAKYYLEYRYLAIRDQNRVFAGMTGLIEQRLSGQVRGANPLISFLEEPALKQKLPAAEPVPAEYVKVFPNSGIARIRRRTVSATVFGGSDWPLGVESGLSSNPTFFTFRKGAAILDSVRMGCNFFSEGAFRSEGLAVSGDTFVLHQRFDVPYYQPLPESERNSKGDYPLTPARDARFWSKLNFPKRPMSNVQTLDQKITVSGKDGAFELHFEITGHDRVPVAIELSFRPGGSFGGAIEEDAESGVRQLKSGFGKYTMGPDSIEFGPGGAEHRFVNLEGHSYTAHRGSLKPGGPCVYITGFTPFRRTLRIA